MESNDVVRVLSVLSIADCPGLIVIQRFIYYRLILTTLPLADYE